MINFRFHLVSVVAVFLALGVGVAMGASFVDRATVETLRGRLDQLEANYRERGDEIVGLRERVDALDRDAAMLVEEGSLLLADRLAGTTVVLLSADGTPSEGLDSARATLARAGAEDGGGIVIELDRLAADADALDDARELVGLSVAAPVRVRERVLISLGEALGTLAAAPPQDASDQGPDPGPEQGPDPGPEQGPDPGPEQGPEQGGPSRPPGPVPGTADDPLSDPGTSPGAASGPADGTAQTDGADTASPSVEEVQAAEEFVSELVRIGIVRLDPAELTADALFGGGPMRFVLVVDDADGDLAGASGAVLPEPGLRDLSIAIATTAPRVLTVAAPAAARADDASADGSSPGQLLTELRDDDAASELLSTVDHLDEVLGRIAVVLAIEEQLEGRVGHYGSGEGATAVLPRVPD